MVGMATTFFFSDIFCLMLWHLVEDEICQLLEEKDSKNTCKRTYKVAQQVFHEYLLKKGIAEQRNCSRKAKLLEF